MILCTAFYSLWLKDILNVILNLFLTVYLYSVSELNGKLFLIFNHSFQAKTPHFKVRLQYSSERPCTHENTTSSFSRSGNDARSSLRTTSGANELPPMTSSSGPFVPVSTRGLTWCKGGVPSRGSHSCRVSRQLRYLFLKSQLLRCRLLRGGAYTGLGSSTNPRTPDPLSLLRRVSSSHARERVGPPTPPPLVPPPSVGCPAVRSAGNLGHWSGT